MSRLVSLLALLCLSLGAACGGSDEEATNSPRQGGSGKAGKGGSGGKAGGAGGAVSGGSGGSTSAGQGGAGSGGTKAGAGGAGASPAAGAGPGAGTGGQATVGGASGGPAAGSPSGGQAGQTGQAGMGGGGPPPVRLCSADLRSVTDEQGAVVEQCPPEKGCAGGVCVEACAAAAAAQGSTGCDYWVPVPAFYEASPAYHGPCHAVFVANTWPRPAKISVSRGGVNYDVTQFGRIPQGGSGSITYAPLPPEGLPPGEVGILFLAASPSAMYQCPVTPAFVGDASIHNSGTGTAFRVTSDTPLTAYDILPYGGASSFLPSATLLFPFASWGSNYLALAPHDGAGSPGAAQSQLWMSIVASADNTTVTVRPKQPLLGGPGVPTAPDNQPTSLQLSAGQVVQWMGSDPSSTIVESDHPVGLTTGTTYLHVATATSPVGGGEDSAHQQLPHVKALGNEYVGPGIRSRQFDGSPESLLYRVMGLVDGTELAWDPPVPGAPTQLGAGQVVEFETTSLFRVRSQDATRPFALTQYMPGCMYSVMNSIGDEEWVTLLPPAQYLQRYVFFTDPTYDNTTLVITRKKGASGSFSDVNVACLEAPVTGWQSVDAEGQYQVAHVDLIKNQMALGNCNTSRHEATSEGAFGVVVWGTATYASYAYPAGGNLGSINEVVIKP